MDPEGTRDPTTQPSGLPVRALPDGSDVRKVIPADLKAVVEATARAFYDDPVFSWAFPSDERRLEQLERGFTLFASRVWFPQDAAYTTDRLIGGAFWMPPGTWHLSPFAQLRMLPAMAMISRGDLPRILRLLNAVEAKHPHEPHWYLPVIGVSPEWQGRGFGAALMRPVMERCDRDELPAYLEASSPRNRALYERHGFATVEEMRVKDSPPFWRMWREPKAGAASR
jgi:ribosomal protein S18 acetylase RimI-like enzyme